MKAALVIDMPESCRTCKFNLRKHNLVSDTIVYCSLTDEVDMYAFSRASSCPLKAVPDDFKIKESGEV